MSLTLQEFNDNFTVTIVHFDESTNDIVVVHFKVQCNINKRLSIHTTTVDTTQLTQGYTHNDVILQAWASVKSIVNAWAAFNLVEDKLSQLSVTSTSNSIDVSTFNAHFSLNIIRFELVPSINPSHWCIGFSACIVGNESTCKNYEALIPLTQQYCNNTVCSNIADAAWEVVKDNICQWAVSKLPTQDVLDTIFVPINF